MVDTHTHARTHTRTHTQLPKSFTQLESPDDKWVHSITKILAENFLESLKMKLLLR
jgi:hypothetical protein